MPQGFTDVGLFSPSLTEHLLEPNAHVWPQVPNGTLTNCSCRMAVIRISQTDAGNRAGDAWSLDGVKASYLKTWQIASTEVWGPWPSIHSHSLPPGTGEVTPATLTLWVLVNGCVRGHALEVARWRPSEDSEEVKGQAKPPQWGWVQNEFPFHVLLECENKNKIS